MVMKMASHHDALEACLFHEKGLVWPHGLEPWMVLGGHIVVS